MVTAALLMQTCGASTSGSENKGYTSPGGTCNILYEEHARTHQGCLDDTDILQLKCPSLGPRSMRGFDMFTIGDCQSLLLKLTNEQETTKKFNHFKTSCPHSNPFKITFVCV